MTAETVHGLPVVAAAFPIRKEVGSRMWVKHLFFTIALLSVLGSGAFGADKPAPERARGVPTGNQTPPPPERLSATPRPEALVVVQAGQLQVQGHNLPLGTLMRAIAQQSGVQISTDEDVAQTPVSVQLKDMPLEQGLRHLLQGFDSFFLYGVQGSGAQARTALQGIWIYAPGQGQRLAPLPPEHWASSQELATGLHDPEEAERARTVELLVERQGTRALDEVLVALEDGDNQVRERALHAALYAGIQLPLPRLAELAQYDLSPLVRFLALGAMVEDTTTADNASVVRIVEQALDDPSPEIREQAWQIIQQWENPAAPFEEEEQQGEAESAEGVSR